MCIRDRCLGSAICASSGVAFGTSLCDDFYGSGDMQWSHPCRDSGSFDAVCIQQLCDSSELCGGYQTTPAGDS